MVPDKYKFLQSPEMPGMVQEALKFYGIKELAGAPSNKVITDWADFVYSVTKTKYSKWAADWYNNDDIAWCGLFVAYLAAKTSNGRKDRMPPDSYLSALAWANFGEAVQFKGKEGYRLGEICIGDVGVFTRNGGGHVGLIVGVSNSNTVFVLGGNQSNSVNVTELAVNRLYAVRRPVYRVRPAGAKHVRMGSTGVLSTNEA